MRGHYRRRSAQTGLSGVVILCWVSGGEGGVPTVDGFRVATVVEGDPDGVMQVESLAEGLLDGR
jgi:hypothetical protein